MLYNARFGGHFFLGIKLDQLLTTAASFSNLLNIEYDFVIGRKSQTVNFKVVFHKSHFYHLAGLHYLTDLQILRGDREIIFDFIMNGTITSIDIEKSVFYSKINARLSALEHLESFFDSDNLVLKYNPEINSFSVIEANYLMENKVSNNKVFTFLSKNPDNKYFCRSFFPMEKQDFSIGQTVWTVLLKNKIDRTTNTVQELFRHNNYKK